MKIKLRSSSSSRASSSDFLDSPKPLVSIVHRFRQVFWATNKRKKRTCRILDFAVSADHRAKLKESKQISTWTLLENWKIYWTWKWRLIHIVIVISALGTVSEGLVQGLENLEIRGRVEIIQSTALLRSAWIPRRVLQTWGDLLPLKLQ